ncbi:MAG: hypothetical protein HS115_11675 [Spirochaetales bacterium]|nr:hypothetical protein [Spirochaetales bacterium]
MKWFYTDDRTGKFSGTTLRSWLLFLLCFSYALALAIGSFLGLEISSAQLDLLGLLLMAFGAGGMLYMGKRINESRSLPRTPERPSVDARQL